MDAEQDRMSELEPNPSAEVSRGLFPTAVIACICLLALLCGGLPTQLPAQDDAAAGGDAEAPNVEIMRTSQLEERAATFTREGQFEKALPYLAELARRFQGTEDENLNEKLEYIYFFLAAGSLEGNQPSQAIEALQRYIEQFPDKPRIQQAQEMLGDAYAASGQVDKALETYREVIARFNLPVRDQAQLVAKQAEVLVEQENLEEAIDPLRQVVQNMGGGDTSLAARALILLTEVYLKLDRFEAIAELMPLLQDPVRGLGADIRLQETLLTQGDRFRDAARPLDALFCYLLIQPLGNIREQLEERREIAQREYAAAMSSRRTDAILRAKNELSALDRQQKSLEQLTGFAEALQVRKAQSFAGLGRRTEAMWAFREIFRQFPDSDLAPQALFGAMLMAAELGQPQRAMEWGEQYLSTFPDSDAWGEVATETAKIGAMTGNMDRAVELALQVIERFPNAPSIAQALYVAGYGLLTQGDPDAAREHLAAIRENHPDQKGVRAESDYWLGMTYLLSLNPDIEKAYEIFSEYVEMFPEGPNIQDARYRVGACLFALNRLDEARQVLEELLQAGLTAEQREDVLLMLGDIAYAAGNLNEAEAYYRELYRTSQVAERRSHGAFRLGTILEAREKWAEALEFYNAYLEEGGMETARAKWRLARCHENLEQGDRQMAILKEAILEAGDDPSQVVVGLMLDDLLEEKTPETVQWMQDQLAAAEDAGQTALALRLRVEMAQANVEGVALPAQVEISEAGPEVLLAMIRRKKESDPARARELAAALEEQLLREPPEIGNTWLLPAWHALADMAMADEDQDRALELLERVVNRGPTSEDAGEATRDIADIYFQQERYREARELYQSVLAVRDWKGPLWAEALFKTGMTYLAEEQPREAFAFFQRTYVLYSAYQEWAAKAYLRSAECLQALGLTSQAAQTLREFLDQEDFEDLPQYEEAERRLAEL